MKTSKVYVLSVLVVMCIFMVIMGCKSDKSDEAGKYGGSFVYGKAHSALTLEPGEIDEGGSSIVTEQIYQTLLSYKAGTTELENTLAEKYETSDDGKEITFYLKKNVYFHDDTVMDADDVLFSFLRQHDKNHPFHNTVNEWKYWYSKGWGNTYDEDGTLKKEGLINDIIKLDDHTVKFVLNEADATFISGLAVHHASIVSDEAAKKHGNDFKKNPVGTGPFKFVEWRKDEAVILTKFDKYWKKGKPLINKLIFKVYPDATARAMALKAGDADMIDSPGPEELSSLISNDKLLVKSKEGLTVGYVALNVERKALKDKRVRKAINHALNKDAIIKAVFGISGKKGNVPYPPQLWGYNETLGDYDYNPGKAKQLLQEAGFENGLNLELLALPVYRPYNPDGMKVAVVMQAQLKEVGIETKIQTYDIGTYWDKVDAGEFDLAMTGWAGEADPDSFTHQLFTHSYLNSSRWYHDEYIDLVTQAKRTFNKEERITLYKKSQEILLDEAPIVMLSYGILFRPMNKNIMGYVMSPLDFHNLEDVWFKQ